MGVQLFMLGAFSSVYLSSDDDLADSTVHTIMFSPELTLSFDDTIKHVLIAGGTPLGKSEGY
jgi:hypothetical protein